MSTNVYSRDVTIHTCVETKGYYCVITAKAVWLVHDEQVSAKSVREIDLYKAQEIKQAVSVEEFIEATKRDALRELVTQLNLHKVL